MRHRKAGKKLGRNATHRVALMRNLARSLFISPKGRIITTLAKAKAARPFVEKLITLAKIDSVHHRRLAAAKLGPMADPAYEVDADDNVVEHKIVKKLFEEIGPRFLDRPGGYTRVIKRHERRLGDAGRTAILELLQEGESKVRAKAPKPPPAPVPKLEEPAGEPSPPY